jgi:hypothetical protein
MNNDNIQVLAIPDWVTAKAIETIREEDTGHPTKEDMIAYRINTLPTAKAVQIMRHRLFCTDPACPANQK